MKKTFTFIIALVIGISAGISQTRKSISILGDSYSTYENYLQPDTNAVWYFKKSNPNNDVTCVSQTWWYKYIKENGYKLCVNNSFSGATICNTGYNKKDFSDRSFITRMKNLGCPDVIFIFGGTNDSWAGAPIGEYKYSDWSKEDLYSFRPAMAYMLEHMKYRYPNVEIYFILNCDLKKEINESVENICRHYSIPCIVLHDIEKQSGHPSIKGMQQINDQIIEFIEKAQ